MAYRISWFKKAGLLPGAEDGRKLDPSREQYFAIARQLKAKGRPFGQALGHSTGDPPGFCYPYMWSPGAMEVDRDGKTVLFNRPEFVDGMKRFVQADPVFSPISWLLRHAGLIARNVNFLGDPVPATASVCLADIWRGVPFLGITILAGLQAVPVELHEGAAMDGATTWARFRHVTVPAIKGVVLIAALLSIIWTFADFQLIYVLTKGGPANQTHVFGTYAYQIGLAATEIGTGAAIALYMFPILAVFAVLLLLYLRREES